MSLGGASAILLGRRKRWIMIKLKKLGATSEEKRVKLDKLELSTKKEFEMLEYLVKKGKVKKTSDNCYYLVKS